MARGGVVGLDFVEAAWGTVSKISCRRVAVSATSAKRAIVGTVAAVVCYSVFPKRVPVLVFQILL